MVGFFLPLLQFFPHVITDYLFLFAVRTARLLLRSREEATEWTASREEGRSGMRAGGWRGARRRATCCTMGTLSYTVILESESRCLFTNSLHHDVLGDCVVLHRHLRDDAQQDSLHFPQVSLPRVNHYGCSSGPPMTGRYT